MTGSVPTILTLLLNVEVAKLYDKGSQEIEMQQNWWAVMMIRGNKANRLWWYNATGSTYIVLAVGATQSKQIKYILFNNKYIYYIIAELNRY